MNHNFAFCVDICACVIEVSVANAKAYLDISENEVLLRLGENYAEQLNRQDIHQLCLIGHCMGGLLALETGRSLRERYGVECTVVLIDPRKGSEYRENELLQERGFGQLIGVDLPLSGHTVSDAVLEAALAGHYARTGLHASKDDLCAMQGEVGACSTALAKIPQRDRLKAMYRTLKNVDNENISTFEIDRMLMYYRIFVHSYKSVIAYRPKPCKIPVHITVCENASSAFMSFMKSESIKQAMDISDDLLKECIVPGDHISCMQKPNVENILGVLKEWGVLNA